MDNKSKVKFMTSSNLYITNLNRALKNIKSDVMADFVRLDQHGLIITTNKVVSPLDLQTIEKYVKNVNNINSNNILALHLPQSKSYLKIIDISYLIEGTNMLINSSMIETILKNTYFFQ